MKTFLTIVVTAVITWIAADLFCGVRKGVAKLWMISAMKAPGRMAIRDIQADMNAGRYDIAKRKIDAFEATWERFSSGPDSCSGTGIGDIMVTFSGIPSDAQATNVEPYRAANGSQPIRSETNSTSPAAGSRR